MQSRDTASRIAPSDPPDAGSSRGGPFAPFRLPHFPSIWGSNALFFFSTQIYLVTLQWVVTELTDSRTILGLAIAIQGVVVAVCSPMAGVLADRFAKRSVVSLTRLGMGLMIVVLAIMMHQGWIALWHVLLASGIGGLLNAIGQPASQTYIFDVVSARNVQPAIAMSSSAIGLGNMFGPALAGVLIAGGGIAGSWSCAAAGLFVAALLLYRIPIRGKAASVSRSPWRELREGFSYVVSTPPVALALLACATAFFNGTIFAMRPVFARDVLELGSTGMGLMAGMAGLGTLLGSIVATMLPNFRRPGLAIAFSMMAFSACVLLYSVANSFAFVLVVEFASGLAGQIWQVSAFSGLQMAVPDRLRGRVMGLLFMVIQLAQVGGLFVGSLADRVGDRWAMGIFGATSLVFLFLLIVFGWSPLSRLGEATRQEAA